MSPKRASGPVSVAVFGMRDLFRELLISAFRADCRFRLCDSPDLAEIIGFSPDVVVVDGARPILAFEAISQLRQAASTRTLLLTPARGDYTISTAGRLGVTGYAHERDSLQVVIDGAWDTARGAIFLSPMVAMLRESDAIVAKLTDREMAVLAHAARGLSDDETATALGMAPATAESHRSRAMRKIGARDWADILAISLSVGIVGLEDIRTNSENRRSARRGAQ